MRKIKMKNWSKGYTIILIVFTVLAAIDITLALYNPTILRYMETNPIYVITGTMLPVVGLNVAVFLVIWYFYPRIKPYGRFLFCNYFVWLSIFRIYAIRNTYKILRSPPAVAVMQTYTTEVKIASYTNTALAYLMPMVITFVVYLLFCLDHKIEKKNETPGLG